jgi:replication factor C large subunit
MRAAINDLQSMTEGTKVLNAASLNSLGWRDERSTIFDVLREIFKTTSAVKARAAINRLDEQPDHILLWVDENLPREYKLPEDLARGYEAVSRADVFLGRVMRRQQFGLWAYARELMSAGVATAKRRSYHEFNRYQFPGWLMLRSRASYGRRLEKEVLLKLGGYAHQSTYTARKDALPLFRQLFDVDSNFAKKFVRELRLEEEQVAFILNLESASPRVRSLMGAAAGEGGSVATSVGEFKDETPKEEEKPAPVKEAAKEEKPDETRQKSLFEF